MTLEESYILNVSYFIFLAIYGAVLSPFFQVRPEPLYFNPIDTLFDHFTYQNVMINGVKGFLRIYNFQSC